MKHIILGSGSASRRKIIAEMGLACLVQSADIDENAIGDRSSSLYANELVLAIAIAKANHILKKLPSNLPSNLLLTADSVVTHNGRIFEKPQNEDEVRSNYNSFGWAPCTVVSAVVITNVTTGARVQGVDASTVYFSPFTKEAVDILIEEGEVYGSSGGIMVEHEVVKPFIKHIEGSEDSIRGLPIDLTTRLLSEIEGGNI